MNGHCSTCDRESQCGYKYKPCDCRDYLKFVQKPTQPSPPTSGFVQIVPDQCDRIVWRGRYYHLPIDQPGEKT